MNTQTLFTLTDKFELNGNFLLPNSLQVTRDFYSNSIMSKKEIIKEVILQYTQGSLGVKK